MITSKFELPKAVVDALRPDDVWLYLQGRGWAGFADSSDEGVVQFFHPSYPDVDILLPFERGLADYSTRMRELVITLATIDQCPVSEILKNLNDLSDAMKL